jgi:hypothetical protein
VALEVRRAIELVRKGERMLADIGIMVGLYVIVRYVSFITRVESRKEHFIVILLAVVCMLVTFICLGDIVITGTDSTPARSLR